MENYYKERIPDLIKKLKSQVNKNMDIIILEVESDLGEDKYFNVLKGRKMACENCISTMQQIDKLESEENPDRNIEKSFFKENLPKLINKMKEFIDINLEVVDINVETEYGITVEDATQQYNELFPSKKIPKSKKNNLEWIVTKLGINNKLPEDKFHAVLKARQVAGLDTEWGLIKIRSLENKLYERADDITKKSSWARESIED